MSGIIAAALTIVVALFFTGFFCALPKATLGGGRRPFPAGKGDVEGMRELANSVRLQLRELEQRID